MQSIEHASFPISSSRHNSEVNKTNFFTSDVSTNNTETVLVILFNERVHISDTGASGIVVLDTQEFGASLLTLLVKYFPSVLSLGRLSNELCFSSSWPTRETPRLSERNKEFECNIENFVRHGCRDYTEGSTIHLNSRKPREPEREKSGGHRVGSLTTTSKRDQPVRSEEISGNFR